MRRVLAISGKRFAGKDTLAAAIAELAAARGVATGLYAFAAESKRLFAAADPGVSLARLLGDRNYKEAWRPQLTEFTVAALRADPLVFCRSVADRAAAADCFAVITDLRLQVEVQHLRSRFAVHVVRVTRTNALREASGWRDTPGVDDHPTETELDDPSLWDEEIFNDGSVAELRWQAAGRLPVWLG